MAPRRARSFQISECGGLALSLIQRVDVVINPISGRSRSRAALDGLCDRMRRAKVEVRVERTQRAGDASDFAARACREGVDVLVVSGGDGTVSEAASGMEGDGVPILVVPGGTENILAKYFGTRPDEAWLWRVFRVHRVIQLDVALHNGRRFLIVAGAGSDAEIVRLLSLRRRGHISYWSYMAPIWRTFWSYRHPNMIVEADGVRIHEGPGWVLVGNVPRYGMGIDILSKAVPNDGLLDVCVFQTGRSIRMIGFLLKALFHRHVACPGVVYRQAGVVRVHSEEAVPLQVDGDFAGWLPAEFRLDGHKARFLVSEQWRMPGVSI